MKSSDPLARILILVLLVGGVTAVIFALTRPAPQPATTPTAAAAVMTRPTRPEADASPIDDDEARRLLFDLSRGSAEEAQTAIDRILATGDMRFAAPFIELFRGRQLGLVLSPAETTFTEALELLTGQTFGLDWGAWIEWYGNTALAPPPGFTGWKGNLLSLIDPRFAEFLQDSYPSNIRVEEIQWGGVVVDGIPALDNPPMIPAAEADYLDPDDAVFGLAINGDVRAYPLRILDWHEMANDVVGDVPVSLAYCTLCGAAIAYDGRASDGETYDFGSSGFLFRSNKLMYDRQTRTLWNQLTGEPVLGELVGTGVTLDLLPVVLTSWQDWQARHPETVVVDLDTGFSRDYTTGSAYGDYFASPDTMFPVAQRDDRLATKEQVYALRLNGEAKAYPIRLLTAEQVVNDVVGQTGVVLIAADEAVSVEGVSRRAGPVTYTAGAAVRAYDRGDRTFAPGPEAGTVVDEDGRSWQVTEDALVGPDGETAPRLGGHLAFWFGWYAFYPETLVYEGAG